MSPRAPLPRTQSCRLPRTPMALCGSQQAALNPAGPRQAVTSRPWGLQLGPLPTGGSGWGSRGPRQPGKPLWSSPPAPATRPLHPELAGQLRTRGGGAEALRDALGKPGARDTTPSPLTSKGEKALPRSVQASGRQRLPLCFLGTKGLLCGAHAAHSPSLSSEEAWEQPGRVCPRQKDFCSHRCLRHLC